MERRDFLKTVSVAAAIGIPGAAFPATGLGHVRESLAKANLAAADLRGRDLSGWCLAGADLRGADLSNARLLRTDLRGAKLNGARLNKAILMGACLSAAALVDADLRKASLHYADLQGIDWTGAKLDSATFHESDMTGADLRQIDSDCYGDADGLARSYLSLNFNNAILDKANLSGLRGDISLESGSLRGAQLIGMHPNDRDDETSANYRISRLDVSGADMTGADLRNLHIPGPIYTSMTEMNEFTGECLDRENLSEVFTYWNVNLTKARLSLGFIDLGFMDDCGFNDYKHSGLGFTGTTKLFLDDLRGENRFNAIISQTEIDGVLYG